MPAATHGNPTQVRGEPGILIPNRNPTQPPTSLLIVRYWPKVVTPTPCPRLAYQSSLPSRTHLGLLPAHGTIEDRRESNPGELSPSEPIRKNPNRLPNRSSIPLGISFRRLFGTHRDSCPYKRTRRAPSQPLFPRRCIFLLPFTPVPRVSEKHRRT
jgi:hypothetical protein